MQSRRRSDGSINVFFFRNGARRADFKSRAKNRFLLCHLFLVLARDLKSPRIRSKNRYFAMLSVIKFAGFLIGFANLPVYSKEPTVEIRFEMQKSISA